VQTSLAVRRQGVQLPPALLMAGKLGSRGRLNAVVPGSLVHIVDQLSGRRYLVDTGASFSIFPHKSSTPPSGQKLTGPDGQLIPCWDEKRIVLVFHGRRFAWTFPLADVEFPIISSTTNFYWVFFEQRTGTTSIVITNTIVGFF
jgi:hypothetical protein